MTFKTEIINKKEFIKVPTKIDKDRIFIEIPKLIIIENDINKKSKFQCKYIGEDK